MNGHNGRQKQWYGGKIGKGGARVNPFDSCRLQQHLPAGRQDSLRVDPERRMSIPLGSRGVKRGRRFFKASDPDPRLVDFIRDECAQLVRIVSAIKTTAERNAQLTKQEEN